MKQIFIYTLQSTRDLTNIKYVGKTSQKLSTRLTLHLFCAKHNVLRYLYNWIRKELSDGFNITISELDSIQVNLSYEWQKLELYWISQITSWGFKLTNLTPGGEGLDDDFCNHKRRLSLLGHHVSDETKHKISVSNKKSKTLIHRLAVKKSMIAKFGIKIKLYTINGLLVKVWDSISEAAAKYGDASNITKCAKHQKHCNTAYGYVWRFTNESYIKNTEQHIIQLNMNYSIVNEFANANEAALKVFNCQNKSVTGGIINCCTFRQKQFRGFLFFYKKDYETGSIPKYSFKYKIGLYTLNNLLIRVFNSANQIEAILGFGKRLVLECCRGKREQHNNYKFKYINEYIV